MTDPTVPSSGRESSRIARLIPFTGFFASILVTAICLGTGAMLDGFRGFVIGGALAFLILGAFLMVAVFFTDAAPTKRSQSD